MTHTKDEALKLALEALEGSTDKTLSIRAITAIKQARSAPVQEWMKPHPKCDGGCMYHCTKGYTQFPECATPPAQPAVPLTDGVTVPMAVLEAAEASLGSFCSDHGWSDKDMQNMDNLSAYIARHKAAHGITKGQP